MVYINESFTVACFLIIWKGLKRANVIHSVASYIISFWGPSMYIVIFTLVRSCPESYISGTGQYNGVTVYNSVYD